MDSSYRHGSIAGRAFWAVTILAISLLYTGCSNPASSTDDSGIQNQSYDGLVNPIDQTAVPEIAPATGNALAALPQIDAGARQYTDTNVLVNLDGTVNLFEDAQLASAYWVQVDGPTAYIAEPASLQTAVVIPDLNDIALLRFLLVAADQSGRTNAASTTVVVTPQPAFARVAGAIVDAGTSVATFKIRLSNPVPEPVVINYQTVEGTAFENLDYLPLTGEVTFDANETEREVPVELLQNPSRDGARNFSLRITSNLADEPFFNSGVTVIAGTPQGSFKPELLFSDAGPIRLVAGETFFNPFEDNWPDSQNADILYFSSDREIATVDAQGVVTAVAAGTATINAVVPATDQQEETTAAYLVQVEPVDAIEQQIEFTRPDTVEVRIGETFSNPVINNPDTAPGTGAITYSSENPDIAQIDDQGNVEPLSAGETVITATKAADDRHGSATASYVLRVVLLPQTLSMTEPVVELAVGQSATNPVATTDEATGSGALTWTSSDPAIAGVDAGGTLTGVAQGEVEITVERAADNRYAATSTTFTVVVSPAELLGQSIRFTTTGTIDALITDTVNNPLAETGSGIGSIRFESTDPYRVTVDEDGQVELLAPGAVTITAFKAGDDVYLPANASYVLRVLLVPQNLIFEQEALQLEVGATGTNPLFQQSLPPGSGAMSYVSSDPSVASVDADGTVVGHATGSATITVSKAADGIYAGTNNTYTVEVIEKTLLTQTLTVREPVVDIVVGQSTTNPVTTNEEGSGALTWTSSDPSIVQVDDSGTLTGVARGEVVVVVERAADNQYAAARTTFEVRVSPVELKEQSIGFSIPGTVEALITDTVTNPLAETGSGNGSIRFESSNSDIATVDNKGLVKLLAPGTVTISASKAGDDTYLPATASYDLRISLIPQSLIFEQETLKIEVGATATNPLNQKSLPPGSGALSYVSSDPAVAIVSVDGEVTGQAEGTATISVSKAADGIYSAANSTYTVDVIKKALLTQTLQFEMAGPLEAFIDEAISNPVIIGPKNGTGAVTYTSSNENVARVAADGSLTLLAAGTTTVTATIAADEKYLGATASYKLSVSLLDRPIEFPDSIIYLTVGQTVQAPLQRVEDFFDDREIVFSSSDESIATVRTSKPTKDSTISQSLVEQSIQIDATNARKRAGNTISTVYLYGVAPGGPVTITATAEASSLYAASSASIQVIVTDLIDFPIISTGSGVIRGTWSWDLDYGGDQVGTDMWWRQKDKINRSLVPADGVQFAVLGKVDFDSITSQQLQQLRYSSDSIDGSDTSKNRLPAGTVVAAITNQGRYSKFQIVEYGYDLRIRWVTYGEYDLY